jgi:hypothetical protein
MRKSFLPLLAAAALPLAGCAALPFLPAAAEVARSLGQQGMIGEDFAAAASEACVARATRYGRATVTRVEPQGASLMRVYGTIEGGYRTRNFVCDFRNNGTVARFDRN